MSETAGTAHVWWFSPLKTAMLVAVMGPAVGGLAMIVVAAGMELSDFFTAGVVPVRSAADVLAFASFASLVMLYSYIFGAVPALAAAVVFGLYLRYGGARPWLAGMIVGTTLISGGFGAFIIANSDQQRSGSAWGGMLLAVLFGLIVSVVTGTLIEVLGRFVSRKTKADERA